MMQEFLNSIAGKNNQPPDPMESITPKHLLGVRNFTPYYMGILGGAIFSLIVTLSEIHPVFSNLLAMFYIGLVIFFTIDIMSDHKKHGYLSKQRIQAYIFFYGVAAVVLTFVISLVSNI